MKRLLVIGAGWEQVPLLEAGRRKGLELYATHPDLPAEGASLAHWFGRLDPRDLTQALAIAREHRIDGVVADACDYSLHAAGYVAECLGLPGPGLTSCQLTTQKGWMREACLQAGVPQPAFLRCRSWEEAEEAGRQLGYPLVVKPVDNRGSIGVRRVDEAGELRLAYLEALAQSHSREVLIEGHLEGVHLTVDGFCLEDGRHLILGVAVKQVAPGERPVILEVGYPAPLTDQQRSKLFEVNQRVVNALGITGGATHAEYILTGDTPCLLEMANRGGGVLTAGRILPAISGFDVPGALVDQALGLPVEVPVIQEKGAVLTFFVFPEGRLDRIGGLQEAQALPGILHVRLLVSSGDALKPVRSGAERHGFLIAVGDDLNQAKARALQATARIRPVYWEELPAHGS